MTTWACTASLGRYGQDSRKDFSSAKWTVLQRFLLSESLDCCCYSFVEAEQPKDWQGKVWNSFKAVASE